jgi:hypothetical protein
MAGSHRASHHPSREVGVFRRVLAAALALAGVLLLLAALTRPSPPPTVAVAPATVGAAPTPSGSVDPTRSPSPVPVASTDVHDRITGHLLPESEPLTVAIPEIGVRSRLVALGLDTRGELEVPQDPAQVGWFSRGAAPGALGPAVLAGHVTWNGAPGVFYALGSLRRGDQVLVTRDDGRTAVFTVTRLARYAKSRFPTDAVYGPVDHAALRLITCGGTYDASRHRYLDNVVVFARLSDVREPRGQLSS